MILHCTPPYDLDIPNPALGYLKGFLENKGIDVKNVYWNLILAKHIFKFQRGLKEYSGDQDALFVSPVVYISKKLLKENWEGTETPLDILYSTIYSREEITDMIGKIKEEIDMYIKQNNLHNPLLAGFTVKCYQWLMSSYLVNRLKEMNPDIQIVLGGIRDPDQGCALMKAINADYAIWGEGEYPLFHLVQAVEEGSPSQNVPNLIYREGKTLRATEKTAVIPHLDSYPFADHSDYVKTFSAHINGGVLSDYIAAFGRYGSDTYPIVIPVWGSRSCTWNKCKFCSLNEEYTYRTRSPQNIVEEIEYQSEKYGVDSFMFMDTEVAGTLKRFKTLLNLLIQSSARRERKYRLFAEVSPLFINAETARLMRLASFAEIQIGFEEMTDQLLEKIDKRHRFAHNIQAVKLGRRYKLKIGGLNVLKGIPTETREDILESCQNLSFLRFFLIEYPLNLGLLRLDKGSPFYEAMTEKERKEWTYNPIWNEIEPLHLIPEEDRYEFFGFYKQWQDRTWNDFERLMNFYKKQDRSYEWVEYKTGSFVEERGPRLYKYICDRDETDLLIFCDTIKTFSQVKKKFSHLSEKILCRMIENLKNVGLVYCDKDMHSIISVLDAYERNSLVQDEQSAKL